MYNVLKIGPDERIDLPDMEALVKELPILDSIQKTRANVMPEGRDVGQAATYARIYDGFGISNIVGGGFDLARGNGVLYITLDGTLYFGIEVGDQGGQDSQAVDLSLYGNDDYGVWVRPTYSEADRENRVFWDTSGEYVESAFTRETMVWEYTVVSTSAPDPSGGDWVKVWEVTVLAGNVTASADYRHFFFEGDSVTGGGQWADEWGAGNDRNADRALYGLKDWHMFAQMVRAQFGTLLGATYAWYEAPDPDLSDLAVEHHTDGQHLEINATSAYLNQRTGGPTDSTTRILTQIAGADHECLFQATDLGTVPLLRIVHDAANVYSILSLEPRGTAGTYVNNDYGDLRALGRDVAGKYHGMRATVIDNAAGDWNYGFGRLDTVPPLQLWEGATYESAGTRGLHLLYGTARYFHTSRTEDIWVSFVGYNDNVAGHNWQRGNNGYWYIGAGNPNEDLFLNIHDWPEQMTLNSVEVKCELLAGAGTALTITAYKEQWGAGGGAITRASMGNTTKTTASREDKVIATADSGWSHKLQRLQLHASSPDVACYVYAVRLNVTYSTVSKWAQTP